MALADYGYRKLIPITGSGAASSPWTSPTGDNDPDPAWTNEGNIWDDNEASFGSCTPPGDSWGGYIELTVAAHQCDRVRIKATKVITWVDQIDIDVHYDGEAANVWHHVYEGSDYNNAAWTTKLLPDGEQTVDGARIRMYNEFATPAIGSIYEFDFMLGEVSGGAGTDYRIPLIVHKGLGVDSPGVVYLENLCTDFPNDIRFTDDDEDTELDYDPIGSDANTAKFLIEIADNLDNNQEFYIYFRKLGAGDGAAEFKEDFTAYTEYEEIGDPISVAAHKIDANLSRNEEAWVVKDKGVNYFENFEHYLKVTPQSATANAALVVIWVLSNAIDNTFGLDAATEDHLHIRFIQTGAGARVVTLLENNSGDWYTDAWAGFAYGTPYYLVVKKLGTALTLGICSDAIFETSLDDLDLTLHADYKFRYVFGCNTHDSGHTPRMDIDIENLFLRRIVDPEPAVGTAGGLEKLIVGIGRLVYGGLVNSGLTGGRLTG